jgi:outer membrane protein assembly factor BamB
VVNGRLYIGEGFHEDSGCKLYCLDAATGEKRWQHETTSHTEATPVVVAGKVYCGAGDDGLYCLDAETGTELWHYQKLHIDSPPRIVDGRLHGGSVVGDEYRDCAVFCLDADTGKQLWRVPVDLPAPGAPVVQDGLVYVGLGNGKFGQSADRPAGALLCLDAASGQRRWHYPVPDSVLARPAVDEQCVYFGACDQHCYALDRQKGRLRWKKDLGSPIVAAPVLFQQARRSFLYVADSAGGVVRLDPDTGATHWRMDVEDNAGLPAALYGSPVVRIDPETQRRRLYFGCALNTFKSGILYCLEEREDETP